MAACEDCISVEACLALVQLKKQADGAGDAADKKKGKKQAAGETPAAHPKRQIHPQALAFFSQYPSAVLAAACCVLQVHSLLTSVSIEVKSLRIWEDAVQCSSGTGHQVVMNWLQNNPCALEAVTSDLLGLL